MRVEVEVMVGDRGHMTVRKRTCGSTGQRPWLVLVRGHEIVLGRCHVAMLVRGLVAVRVKDMCQ